MNHVIHIYGASGSGTSTLGAYICQQTGYAFMDTDDYFWMPTDPPFTTKRKISERIALMREEIEAKGNVVISGSLVDWGDELIPLFTLAIRVTTDMAIRLERLERRERAQFGDRLDPGGDMYDNHLEFMEWAAGYDSGGLDTRSRKKHDAWQTLLLCPQIEVDGSDSLEYNFEFVRKHLAM